MMAYKVLIGFRALLSGDHRTWNVQFLFSDDSEEHDQFLCDAVGTHQMLHEIGNFAIRRVTTPQ